MKNIDKVPSAVLEDAELTDNPRYDAQPTTGVARKIALAQPQVAPVAPWLLTVSGLYTWSRLQNGAAGHDPSGSSAAPFSFSREELRLDVDGHYPQMKCSGTAYHGLSTRTHWIADLTSTGANTYAGNIWYKDGNLGGFPYTNITLQVSPSALPHQRKLTVTFGGGGGNGQIRRYAWQSCAFRPVEFEYDTVAGTTAVVSFNLADHPNRPSSLDPGELTIEAAYRQAGFDVSLSTGNDSIPLVAAGADALWTDMEMHDAMQVYWTRFANKAQSSVWTLFASQHAPDPAAGITPQNLGGVMFDSIGPNQRQGTAVFNESFINTPPAGDPNAAAAVQRLKFWTACHELGHTFNLAHAWQKSLGTSWIPLNDDHEARSFMNYPFRVAGGPAAFFANFEYRFSDDELTFLRHAPLRFVQQGNADWFDDHGFEQAERSLAPELGLQVRTHRELGHFEFMEPVNVELKLTNLTNQPQLVQETVLSRTEELTVILKKEGKPARRWLPYARYVFHADKRVLAAGESMYGTLFVSAGHNGWDLAEPGRYTIQIALRHAGEDIVSNPLQVRVAPPRGYDEEFLAQDLFTEDLGRTLNFGGTRALDKANDILREISARLQDRRIADHARVVLAQPLMRPFKALTIGGGNGHGAAAKEVVLLGAQQDLARANMQRALDHDASKAADTFGHISYRNLVSQFASFLSREGEPQAGAKCLKSAEQTLSKRGVLPTVLNDLSNERKAMDTKK